MERKIPENLLGITTGQQVLIVLLTTSTPEFTIILREGLGAFLPGRRYLLQSDPVGISVMKPQVLDLELSIFLESHQ